MAQGYKSRRSLQDRQELLDEETPQRRHRKYVKYGTHRRSTTLFLPSYWTISHSRSHEDPAVVEAGERSTEAITNLIFQTWDPNLVGQGRDARGLTRCNIQVLNVWRVENSELFRGYNLERQKLIKECRIRKRNCRDIQELPGSNGRPLTSDTLENFMKLELNTKVNEHYLFHGTKPENVDSILSNGLDPSYSSLHGMFGQAVYVAESFTKSDQYTDPKNARSNPETELYMILARVLLGRVYVCHDQNRTQELHGPPCTSCEMDDCVCPSSHSRYDSVMADGRWIFREFVVFHKNRCYPEYVIKYRRKQKSSSSSLSSLSSTASSLPPIPAPTPVPRPPPPPPPPPPPSSSSSCCPSCVLL